MNSSSEKDIDLLFHKYCPNDQVLDQNSLLSFKQEFLASFQFLQNPDSLMQALQNFILQKATKTNKIQYLELFSQLLKEAYTSHRKISECFFFPSKENESKLIEYLNLATQELDLCIFTLTNNALASTLLNLFENKNVKIRIISDDANMAHMGSDLATLASKIPVRTDRDLFAHMHNKYVVIDRKILITGSFNWTAQAVSRNNENVVVLEDEELSLKYKEDFERLWKLFEDNVVTGVGDLERLRPKDPSQQKKRGRKKKEETEEDKKEKEEKLQKKKEKKELQEKKKLEKLEKKGKKNDTDKPKREKKEKTAKKEPKVPKERKTPKEKIFSGVQKKIAKRERIPRKAKKLKIRHVPFKKFIERVKLVHERLEKKNGKHEEKVEKVLIGHENNNNLNHIKH